MFKVCQAFIGSRCLRPGGTNNPLYNPCLACLASQRPGLLALLAWLAAGCWLSAFPLAGQTLVWYEIHYKYGIDTDKIRHVSQICQFTHETVQFCLYGNHNR
jgi:hypothetical protein